MALKVGDLTKKSPLRTIQEESVTSKDTSQDTSNNHEINYPEDVVFDQDPYISMYNEEVVDTSKTIVNVKDDNRTEAYIDTVIKYPNDTIIKYPKEEDDALLKDQSFVEELKTFVLNSAGSFYATYIKHYHPTQLQKGGNGIREEAATQIIEFGKVLLKKLKRV